MGVPGIDVKVRGNRRTLLLIGILAPMLLIVGCANEFGEGQEGGVVTVVPTGKIISGEEALRLYGIDARREEESSLAWATLEPWFPMEVWVSASVLPYEDPDPILVIPVYADSELGVQSTWVGDLEVGTNVMLLSVHPDGGSCFVEGVAVQGWEVEGWVACNRLLLSESSSTPVPNGF